MSKRQTVQAVTFHACTSVFVARIFAAPIAVNMARPFFVYRQWDVERMEPACALRCGTRVPAPLWRWILAVEGLEG